MADVASDPARLGFRTDRNPELMAVTPGESVAACGSVAMLLLMFTYSRSVEWPWASLCHSLARLATSKEQQTEDFAIQAAWGVTNSQTVKQPDVAFLCVSLCPISVCLPILGV